MPTTLADLMNAAYRAAGLLHRPGWTLGTDYSTADIPALNRMMASWSIDGLKIFTTAISDPIPLTTGKKTYTIGPGGEIDMDRPNLIKGADILFPTTPIVRRPVHILTDYQWQRVTIQDVPGAPPYQLYFDGGCDANGQGMIYLRFQPTAGFSLELYTWQALKSSFGATTDAFLAPDGYEEAVVWNFAVRLAGLYPNEATLSGIARQEAEASLRRLEALHVNSPRLEPEPGLVPENLGPGYGWLDRGFGQE